MHRNPRVRARALRMRRGLSRVLQTAMALSTTATTLPTLPRLCVFDLDACLWDKEMFEMPSVPTASNVVRGDLNGRGEGVIGVMSGRNKISLHEGSLVALQEHNDDKFPGMKVALASSANTPLACQSGRARRLWRCLEQRSRAWDRAAVLRHCFRVAPPRRLLATCCSRTT